VPHPLRFVQRVGGAQLIRKENFGFPILCGFAFGKGWGFFFFRRAPIQNLRSLKVQLRHLYLFVVEVLIPT